MERLLELPYKNDLWCFRKMHSSFQRRVGETKSSQSSLQPLSPAAIGSERCLPWTITNKRYRDPQVPHQALPSFKPGPPPKRRPQGKNTLAGIFGWFVCISHLFCLLHSQLSRRFPPKHLPYVDHLVPEPCCEPCDPVSSVPLPKHAQTKPAPKVPKLPQHMLSWSGGSSIVSGGGTTPSARMFPVDHCHSLPYRFSSCASNPSRQAPRRPCSVVELLCERDSFVSRVCECESLDSSLPSHRPRGSRTRVHHEATGVTATARLPLTHADTLLRFPHLDDRSLLGTGVLLNISLSSPTNLGPSMPQTQYSPPQGLETGLHCAVLGASNASPPCDKCDIEVVVTELPFKPPREPLTGLRTGRLLIPAFLPTNLFGYLKMGRRGRGVAKPQTSSLPPPLQQPPHFAFGSKRQADQGASLVTGHTAAEKTQFQKARPYLSFKLKLHPPPPPSLPAACSPRLGTSQYRLRATTAESLVGGSGMLAGRSRVETIPRFPLASSRGGKSQGKADRHRQTD